MSSTSKGLRIPLARTWTSGRHASAAPIRFQPAERPSPSSAPPKQQPWGGPAASPPEPLHPSPSTDEPPPRTEASPHAAPGDPRMGSRSHTSRNSSRKGPESVVTSSGEPGFQTVDLLRSGWIIPQGNRGRSGGRKRRKSREEGDGMRLQVKAAASEDSIPRAATSRSTSSSSGGDWRKAAADPHPLLEREEGISQRRSGGDEEGRSPFHTASSSPSQSGEWEMANRRQLTARCNIWIC